MYIDVRIPFDENGHLADAYNRALENSNADWVLFLDHDVFLANPRWYEMCLEAVDTLKVDPLAACIGCLAGGEHHKRTMREKGVPSDHLELYIKESKNYYYQYGNMLQRIHEHAAGYFLLLNRKIAKEVGFRQVQEGINNIDENFGSRLIKAGYHIYMMRGLYIYHRRGMKHLRNEFVIQND